MTDQRIEGTAQRIGGDAQNGIGRLLGDNKMQFDGAYNQVKGTAKDVYGQAMDALDGLVDKVPANMQAQARQGVDFARRKPLLTTLAVAGIGLLLARSGRRR